VRGIDDGKYLYLFSGMHSWSFSFSLMKVGQFLSVAPCIFASLPVQLVHSKSSLSMAIHIVVRCFPLHLVHVSVSALQSGT
jgi:hypothetical protein